MVTRLVIRNRCLSQFGGSYALLLVANIPHSRDCDVTQSRKCPRSTPLRRSIAVTGPQEISARSVSPCSGLRGVGLPNRKV